MTKKNALILFSSILFIVVIVLTSFSFTLDNKYASAIESEDSLEFVYFDQKSVDLGQELNIVASFNNQEDSCDSVLLYHNQENGLHYEAKAYQSKDGMSLYKLTFSSIDQIGIYVLDSIVWHNRNLYIQHLEENTFCVNDVESYMPNKNTAISFTDNDNVRNGNLIVCLDPGHGGSDGGAVYEGHRECDLNWRIATSCKAELEQYEGVEVLLTRSQDETLESLEERVMRAVRSGSNLFVSLHNNSSESGDASGSEVWIQHHQGWHYEFSDIDDDIGLRILNKLHDTFGLFNRGTKSRFSTDGSTYPDGTPGDYFSVLYHSRLHHIPAMIVEHAFMNGSATDQAALYNETNLDIMGQIDATAIAEHYGLHKRSLHPEILNGTFTVSTALNDNMLLDVNSASKEDSANVQIFHSNGTAAQKWNINTDGNTGIATITNLNSGKVLDIAAGVFASGSNVQQYGYNETNAQKWIISRKDDSYEIVSAANNNFVLDVACAVSDDGTNVQIYNSNGSSAQRWKFNRIESQSEIVNGKYTISTVLNSNMVVETGAALLEDKANVQLYTSNHTKAQQWNFSTDDNGLVQIVNVCSNKALEIDGQIRSGSNVVQNTINGSDNQKWRIVKDIFGYRIVSYVNSDIVLDLDSGMSKDMTNVQVYDVNGTKAQYWDFKKVDDADSEIINGNFIVTSYLAYEKVIDVNCASHENAANVQIFENNYTNAQRWKISTDPITKNATIINCESGKALDVSCGVYMPGTNIQQWDSNHTDAQLWKIRKSEGGYKFVSVGDPDYVLDISGGCLDNCSNIQIYPDNGTVAQRFHLFDEKIQVDPSTVNIDEGFYRINSCINSDKVIDVAAASVDDGANVQIFSWNNTNAQKFKIKKEGNFYRFECAQSGKSIDLDSGHFVPVPNVQQWSSISSNSNQLWAAYGQPDGNIVFKNVASGLVMDVFGGVDADSQNIEGYIQNGSSAQKWKIQRVEDPILGTPIMFGPRTDTAHMISYFNRRGVPYPTNVYSNKGAPNIEVFCNLCISTAISEGVDPLVLFSQAMLETNALQFGGQVKAEQCNFGGLGASDGGAHGETFSNVEIGLLAQVQHLKAYASHAALNRPCVDTRFAYVSRGSAPRVEDLGNGKWASDPNYAAKMLQIMDNVRR